MGGCKSPCSLLTSLSFLSCFMVKQFSAKAKHNCPHKTYKVVLSLKWTICLMTKPKTFTHFMTTLGNPQLQSNKSLHIKATCNKSCVFHCKGFFPWHYFFQHTHRCASWWNKQTTKHTMFSIPMGFPSWIEYFHQGPSGFQTMKILILLLNVCQNDRNFWHCFGRWVYLCFIF